MPGEKPSHIFLNLYHNITYYVCIIFYIINYYTTWIYTNSIDIIMQRKPKKNQSPQARPRRRASQTFLIKYQLARNPLKAEEEDLKLALKESLEQCHLNGIIEGPITTPPLSTPPPLSSSTKTKTTASKTKSNQKSKTTSNKNRQTIAKTKSTTANGVNHPVSKKHAQNSKYGYNHSNHNNNYNNIHYTAQYSPYFPILKKETPDEEYLKKYRPDTHDFLSFICHRSTTAQDNNNNNLTDSANSSINDDNNNNNHNSNNNNDSNNVTNNLSIETHSNGDNSNNSMIRRPIRQSPRLATRQSNKITGNGRNKRKISDHANDNNNNNNNNITTSNGINYEENLELASNALDLMAMESMSSLGIKTKKDDGPQNHDLRDAISKTSSSTAATTSIKGSNRQYYVKGLMTKEFTGGFAKIHDCQTNKNIVQLI